MTPSISGAYRKKSLIVMDLVVLIISAAPVFHGWKATPLFYSAVYRIQGHAALHGGATPKSHGQRKRYVKEHLPDLLDAYEILYVMSMIARYDPRERITRDDAEQARDLYEYIAGALP